MRHVHMSELDEEREFVLEAARQMGENPNLTTKGTVEPGSLFAVRWGLGEDCLLVFRLDPDHEPTIYAQVIRKPEQGAKPKGVEA